MALASPAHAERRLALVVGANAGWASDRPLRFAEEDARRVRDVLVELGGVAPHDVTLLLEPSTTTLLEAFAALEAKARSSPEPTFFSFFYSGHADENALHLRGPPLKPQALVERLGRTGATLTVAVVDACRSGAILGTKGASPTSPFRIQAEEPVQGLALLSSSDADELSQESKALAGSVFTHHWVSGLRGAADGDGDGLVKLSEAYGYAYQRTRQSTFGTRGGVQRPSFHLELEGQGELVLSRLERASSTVVLDVPEAERWQLSRSGSVVALLEREASGLVLAVPAGAYQVQARTAAEVLTARVALAAGQRVVVSRASMTAEPLSVATAKGASASIGLSASATAASSVVAGVPWFAGVEAKVSANEVVTLGPVNVLGLGFGWRGGRGDAVAFGQHELELRAALGHQFDWGRWMVVPAVEVGGWLALQRGTPGGDRTSLGAVGLASVEGRWRPWRALAVSVGVAGGGVLVNKSGPAVVPRVSGSVGVVGFFE